MLDVTPRGLVQSSSRILKLAALRSGERRGEREGHVMQIVAALWQEISVYSVSPK
jgi:hypothetical protein